jgi:hypothetical protein
MLTSSDVEGAQEDADSAGWTTKKDADFMSCSEHLCPKCGEAQK